MKTRQAKISAKYSGICTYIGSISFKDTETDSEEGGKAERKLELPPMLKGRVNMAEWWITFVIDRQIAGSFRKARDSFAALTFVLPFTEPSNKDSAIIMLK